MQVIRMGQDQFIYTVQKQSIHFGVTVHEHFPKQIQNDLPNFKLCVKFCACSIQCKQQTCNCSGVNMFPSDKYVVRLVRPSFRSPQCVDEQYRIMVSMSSINRWLSSLFLDPFHDPDWTEKKKKKTNRKHEFAIPLQLFKITHIIPSVWIEAPFRTNWRRFTLIRLIARYFSIQI